MKSTLGQKDSIRDYLREIPNYLVLFIFPFFFLTLSPILLDISESTGIELEALTMIFTFYTLGGMAGQLTSVLFNRKFKSLIIIVTSLIILVPVSLILARVKDKYSFYILYAIVGYFIGVIWVQINQNILRSRIKNKDRLMTLTFSFFSVGAIITPYISSAIVRRGIDWHIIYYIQVFLSILMIIIFLTINRKIKYLSPRPGKKISFRKIFINRTRNIIFILTLLMMAAYIISETVIITWAPTFFRVEKLFTVREGALTGSLFWIGVISGRIVSSIIAGKIKVYYHILILSGIAFISASIIYFLESKSAVFAVMVILGFGFSAIYPLLLSLGGSLYRLGTSLLLTIMFTITNIGVSVTPSFIRYLLKYGMPASVSLVPVSMIVFTIFAVILIIYSRRPGAAEEIL